MSEDSGRGNWVGILELLEPLTEECGEYRVVVKVERPFWTRLLGKSSGLRANRAIPISRIELARETWELCVHAPGLMKENPVGQDVLSFGTLVEELSGHVEDASHCHLVLSDEQVVDRAAVRKLATEKGTEWSGPDLDTLADDEFVIRFDVPIRELKIFVTPEGEEVMLVVE